MTGRPLDSDDAWRAAFAAGASVAEAARAMGRAWTTARDAARRLGLTPPDARGANLVALRADPAVRARLADAARVAYLRSLGPAGSEARRLRAARCVALHAPHLARLSAAQAEDYALLRRKGYAKAEALAAIGRADLAGAVA